MNGAASNPCVHDVRLDPIKIVVFALEEPRLFLRFCFVNVAHPPLTRHTGNESGIEIALQKAAGRDRSCCILRPHLFLKRSMNLHLLAIACKLFNICQILFCLSTYQKNYCVLRQMGRYWVLHRVLLFLWCGYRQPSKRSLAKSCIILWPGEHQWYIQQHFKYILHSNGQYFLSRWRGGDKFFAKKGLVCVFFVYALVIPK